ncbi:glycerol-3-phosphate ABC transporter, periplasmic glycerol-3-phosphate-binding protein [Geomicrobium sp. JCM 19037]|uniref:ABC transporter substrate-binding protein n=1 Tax=Geomicrobium sp. JCM 19037 TaxID=1460634 RepID=UPI00045F2484|nr:ABC transporter substrate-binding protein [Geomicrobium sp. JCM 19037]GAK05282.1 glycerol-3-phosphate ABC transporter, periplasmic glycerol-3-phosphate-binding protein [Geomicrobium sp. JCM 19037]
MWKPNFYVLVISMSALMLAACGESEGESPEATASLSNDPIEIEYWYAFGDKIGENNEALVEQFNEVQDDIIVTAHYQGNYEDLHSQTQASIAAGNAPHVTLNEIASMGAFAEAGMTEDLTSYIEEDNIDLNDFVEGLMGNSYIGEGIYGLPYLRSTPILYVNKTMMEEAGLDSSGPETWEEFEEYARALTNDKGGVGMTMPVNIWFYEAFVKQSGGSVLNDDETEATFNEAPGVAAVEFIQRMYNEGTIKVPTGDEAGQVALQDFTNQNAGMVFSSTADLTNYLSIAEEAGFEVNTAFMPQNEQYGTPTGGANLVMVSGHPDEEKKAAWEFIKWMTEPEQTVTASTNTGYLPMRESAIESEEMQSLYEQVPQYKVAVDQLEYAGPRPLNANYAEAQNILNDAITSALIEYNQTPQEALDEAAVRINSLLK